MIARFIWRVVVFFILAIVISVPSLAQGPTKAIRDVTDKIIAIVSDPALKAPEKEPEKKSLIRKYVYESFDEKRMSRSALGRHWAKRTDEEKKEFSRLFKELLEDTYLDKVEGYSGEKVIYEGEKVDGDYGIVKVNIITKNQKKISVIYRLRKKKDKWSIYDISIEGVSMINNYRTQFNSIIIRSSYKNLIEKLKAKVETN
ncbi:MAG TPA: organic solvent tolerance ABC transporter substrate-binding protein [Desulfobacteraceae bacterium]|nr:organic solvent tolerance ABC transporter substrate-binding protein [Desulfobacteraceae bacterium]